jgi:hypothetical protein
MVKSGILPKRALPSINIIAMRDREEIRLAKSSSKSNISRSTSKEIKIIAIKHSKDPIAITLKIKTLTTIVCQSGKRKYKIGTINKTEGMPLASI